MVLFNGLSASFANGSDTNADTLITAVVPDRATTGPTTVLTPQGNVTSLSPFTVPVPLTVQHSGANQIQVSWSADAADFLLETSADLAGPNWQEVSTSPSVGTNQVIWSAPLTGSGQLFRLRQP